MEIKIWAEPQPNLKQCKFVLENPLFERGAFAFESSEQSQGSEMPRAVFAVDGVVHVLVTPKDVLVTQSGEKDWRVIGKEVGQAIRGAIQSGKPLIANELTQKTDDEEQLFQSVSDVLQNQVNPSVASHGGSIEIVDVKRRDVFLKMNGGCQGCGMAAQTLRQGVEETLRKSIPDLGQVFDTTDHSAGTNPYA